MNSYLVCKTVVDSACTEWVQVGAFTVENFMDLAPQILICFIVAWGFREIREAITNRKS